MTRPKHYPRVRWYAVRRNRRGEPTTVVGLDELLTPLVRKACRAAMRPNPMFRMFTIPRSIRSIVDEATP